MIYKGYSPKYATLPNHAIIMRCLWERGKLQDEAMAELDRRGLWLTPDQKRQAGRCKTKAA